MVPVRLAAGAALALVLAAPLQAQQTDEAKLAAAVQMLRTDVRAQAQEVMLAALRLPEADVQKFAPIYRTYETERAALIDQRVALIKEYAAGFSTMDGAAANSLAERNLRIEGDLLKLREKYFKAVSKQVSPLAGARFAQVDQVLQKLIDVQIASELPIFPGK